MSGEHPTTDEPISAGVCLSGGGFRASLYGLGVLRYLAEARFLPSVATLCGVSGGSIAAAAATAGWLRAGGAPKDRAVFDEVVFDRFLSTMDAHDVRDRTLARWTAQRWKPWAAEVSSNGTRASAPQRRFREPLRLSVLVVRPSLDLHAQAGATAIQSTRPSIVTCSPARPSSSPPIASSRASVSPAM